jgi:cation:H+ antiporter
VAPVADVPLDFRSYPLTANLATFAVAALVVWFAGSRLAALADDIADRTGLNRAFLGVVLLGVATSLPEVATTITGAVVGNPQLVTANLLGGVALQITILAICDAFVVRGALTFFSPQPVLLFQGVMLLALLALALAGGAAGEPIAFAGVGATTPVLAAGYLFTVRFSKGGDLLPRWRATHEPPPLEPSPDLAGPFNGAQRPVGRLWAITGGYGLLILTAGWALAATGDAVAQQTHLGSNFVGFALVAASTSLPELSTTMGALRRHRYQMAVSNILGTNCLEVALFLLADVVYQGEPILAQMDRSALFAGTLGMIVTSIFLIGLLERRDRTLLRMGIDSCAVLFTYGVGLVALYTLR